MIAAVVFVLLPAMLGRGGGKRLPPFGSYNGHEIRYESGTLFADYVSKYADMMKGQGMEVDQQSYFYIFNYAFNAVVQKMAYDEAVKEAGYAVPPSAVDRMMLPYFSENGVYSPKLYRAASDETIQKMRREIEDNLTTSRYTDDVLGSADSVGKDSLYGLKMPSNMVKAVKDMGKEKRGISVVSFRMDDYPDSEKVAYGKANADKFKKYNMSVITCDDKAAAQSVKKRLSNNEISFEDAVGEYSRKAYSDENGKLNGSYRYQLEKTVTDKDALNVLDGLAAGSVSDVIETSGTYSIFRTDAASISPNFSDDSTVRDVYNYLNTYESSIMEDYFVAKAKEFVISAVSLSFQTACESKGLKPNTVAPFALNYGGAPCMSRLDTSVSGMDGADTNEEFLKRVFSLKMGEISEPIINGRNVIVVKLDKIETEDLPPEKEVVSDMCQSMNRDSMNTAIMSSKKLENNLISVFFNNFLNYGE